MLKAAADISLSLGKHRDLLWQFTKRQVELRHKGSHLGLIWSLLNPLLMLLLYVLVFGFIFGGRFNVTGAESRLEYALTLFLGLAIYHFVAEVISTAPMLVLSNPNFVKKVVFPLEILPAANVGSALFHFGITLVLVLLGALLTGVQLKPGILWLPVLIVPLVLTGLGLTLAISSLGVFWRDIAQVAQYFALVLMFASAVFYPVSQIPSAAWAVLKYNPLLLTIEEARKAIFWAHPVNLVHCGYLYLTGLATLVLGAGLFQRLRGSFADVL
jgi:lipopolysaccharide transport system permease protein